MKPNTTQKTTPTKRLNHCRKFCLELMKRRIKIGCTFTNISQKPIFAKNFKNRLCRRHGQRIAAKG